MKNEREKQHRKFRARIRIQRDQNENKQFSHLTPRGIMLFQSGPKPSNITDTHYKKLLYIAVRELKFLLEW